jgi:sec-independent protein translocase protein TatA
MGALSIWHILAVVGVGALLFGGGGRLSSVMGDAAKGLRAFREGLKEEATAPEDPARLSAPPAAPARAKT